MSETKNDKPVDNNILATDVFLQLLSTFVNGKSGIDGIGITLLCDGFLVSGKLIGFAEYTDAFGDLMSHIVEEDLRPALVTPFKEFAENLNLEMPIMRMTTNLSI